MYNKKQDLRVVKTKRLLYDTLIDLMKEMPFEEIKVSDICNRALINRSTFYSHYTDKYDLFSEYINDLKNTLATSLENNRDYKDAREYYIELISIFLNHVEDNREMYRLILLNNKNSIVMDIVYDVLDNDIKKHIYEFDKNNKSVPIDIVTKFYLGAIFNVGIEYLNSEYKYTKEQIVRYISLLIPKEISSL